MKCPNKIVPLRGFSNILLDIIDRAVNADLSQPIIRQNCKAYRIKSDIAADISGLMSWSVFPTIPRPNAKHALEQDSASSASAPLLDCVSCEAA